MGGFRYVLIMGCLPGLLAFSMGCGSGGPSRVGVSGTVLLDGEPVPEGTVVFVPEGEGIRAGGPIENGKYSVAAAFGPNLGKHKVEITWPKKTGRVINTPKTEGETDERTEAIPEKYNKNTTLVVTIQPGANQHDFDLKSK